MDHQQERQLELYALDSGSTPLEVLMQRVQRTRPEKDRALEELRAVMSDTEVLEEFGIDVNQLLT